MQGAKTSKKEIGLNDMEWSPIQFFLGVFTGIALVRIFNQIVSAIRSWKD